MLFRSGKFSNFTFALLSRQGDFDAFSQFANGITQSDHGNFPILKQLFAPLFFFLPRSIWMDKPTDTGAELARLLGLKYQNLSAPWLLESYVNLRIPGLILSAIVLGFFLTKIQLISNRSIKSTLFSSLSLGILFIVLRGSLLQATGRATFSIFLILWFCRKLK